MSLPGASELFRSTSAAPRSSLRSSPGESAEAESGAGGAESAHANSQPARGRASQASAAQPSGRKRHDEKITVYVSAAELVALEQTRLSLRVDHGMACDRGRIVREAVAVLLSDYEQRGESSTLVRRLADG